jgi:PAS domain-containing protein
MFSGFLLGCILLNFIGQIYMSFSNQPHDAFFDFAHIANILSYCMPVTGFAMQATNEIKRANKELIARRQIEETLKQSEEHFRLLYVQSPVAYQSLDEDGNFLEVNPAWLSILGYEKEEVIGKNFTDFTASGFPEQFKELFPCFKAAGESYGVPYTIGKERWQPYRCRI